MRRLEEVAMCSRTYLQAKHRYAWRVCEERRYEGMGIGGMRYNVVAPMSLCRCKYSCRSISPRA